MDRRIELYEDSDGILTLWNPERRLGWTGLRAVDAGRDRFIPHAKMLLAVCDDWHAFEHMTRITGDQVLDLPASCQLIAVFHAEVRGAMGATVLQDGRNVGPHEARYLGLTCDSD